MSHGSHISIGIAAAATGTPAPTGMSLGTAIASTTGPLTRTFIGKTLNESTMIVEIQIKFYLTL